MRIAVIGSGIAGLSAAWRLSESNEVVLYEASDTLGGHARTIDFKGESGVIPVDFGFMLCTPWMYPNFFALLDSLGIVAQPISPGVTMSASFAEGHWGTYGESPLKQRMRSEISRFERLMQQVMARPADSIELTLGMLLDREGFSKEFQEEFVVPMMSLLFITSRGALDLACLTAAFCVGPASMVSINFPVPFSTIEGGSREYVRRLVDRINADIRTETAVRSVVRSAANVSVTDEFGRSETYDEVVIATDAETALKILDRPTADEQLLLGDVEYSTCEIVVHNDRSVLPRDDDDSVSFVYVEKGATPKATSRYSTYVMRQIQSWIDTDIYATLDPPEGLIDPAKIQHVQTGWKHLIGDLMHALRSAEMHRIQGKCRTWFCGSYVADAGWHEGALITGLAVAAAIGATYPFEEFEPARIGFEELAAHHMRIVDIPRNVADRDVMWPAPALSIPSKLTEQLVKNEIGNKLSFGLPDMVFGRFSPLGWLQSAAIRMIAPGISPYEEVLKELEAESIEE